MPPRCGSKSMISRLLRLEHACLSPASAHSGILAVVDVQFATVSLVAGRGEDLPVARKGAPVRTRLRHHGVVGDVVVQTWPKIGLADQHVTRKAENLKEFRLRHLPVVLEVGLEMEGPKPSKFRHTFGSVRIKSGYESLKVRKTLPKFAQIFFSL